MADGREYRFHLDTFTPDTLPMSRLSEYLCDLAILLGSQEHVHFIGVQEAASTNLAFKVDPPAVAQSRRRLELVSKRSPDAPNDAVQAFDSINARLIKDHASAQIESEADVGSILSFPGKLETASIGSQVFGPIIEPGTIDGQIVRVGGFDKTIPVHMRSGKMVHYCNAEEDMARRLGPFILGKPVRVFGNGKWYRDESENWNRKVFTITAFEELEDVTLVDSLDRLRSIPSALHTIQDPLALLDLIRYGSESSAKE